MCKSCECETLDDFGDWIFDEAFHIGEEKYSVAVALCPGKKALNVSIVTSPVLYKEYMPKYVDIKYCPFCGRELVSVV